VSISRTLRPFPLLALFAAPCLSASGCGPDATPTAVTPAASAAPSSSAALPTPSASTSASTLAKAPWVPAPIRYENPGGMWMPAQMGAHAAKLRELGLAIDPAALADPASDLMGSIVNLNGCSASFVSAEGLVITNHHCATAALQFNSSASSNLFRDGFLAKTRAEERSNGPTARVLVTQKITDVTDRIVDEKKLAKLGDRARYLAIEAAQKQAVAACEAGRPGIRCAATSYYEGERYFLVEQLEIRDVRLVWAPPVGVGNYGGEIDNWRWPRHTGDVAIFRAYVGKDGQTADYSPDNVPFASKHHLSLATQPLRESDLVLVAGYPGRTFSLKSFAETEDAVSFRYPRQQKLCEDMLARLDTLTDPEARVRAVPLVRRYGNALTNVKGQLEGLVAGGLLAERKSREEALIKWIEADPARKAKYGKSIDQLNKAYAEAKKHREADAELRSEFLVPKLVNAAYQIVRMAEERPKADKDRHPDYQERNWPRIAQSLDALDKQYHRDVDVALLGLALERSAKAPAAERAKVAELIAQIAPKAATGPNLAALFESELASKDKRSDLFRSAKLADLKKSKDPMIRLALALRPMLKEADEREEALSGLLQREKSRYVTALREQLGKELAPDANGTLRISYGTVRGYAPKPGAPIYRPFTMLSEMLTKNTGKDPFEVPLALVAANDAKRFGPYVDAALGEIPVDFLSDIHITGGNSGSATLNARGELVGLAFDGNYEALGSDWQFQPTVARSIHVDIRYVEWLLDAVFGGDALLAEMGVKPSIP
jgi:hypothetical protein